MYRSFLNLTDYKIVRFFVESYWQRGEREPTISQVQKGDSNTGALTLGGAHKKETLFSKQRKIQSQEQKTQETMTIAYSFYSL